MKRTLFLAALSLSCSTTSLFAQKEIEGHYGKRGYDIAYTAAATSDGGYIISGLTQSMGDSVGDIVVIKLNAHGDTLWTLKYGGPNLEGGNGVIQTADGGYMVSGHTEDFGARDCDGFLMKLDANGNHEWFKVYGGDRDDISEGVLEVPGGGYIFAGITASWGNATPSDVRHIYFVRTNSTGDTLWTKYYGGTGWEYAYSIAPQADGYLAAAVTTSFGSGEIDGWLMRLNSTGDTTWTRLYRNAGNTRLFRILPTHDKGYMMAGYTTQTQTCKSQGLVVKLDRNGNELWQRTYGDTSTGMQLHDVAELPNGNLMFTGSSYTRDTLGEVYILETDAKGNKLSDEIRGGSNSAANCIAVQGNNSYLVAGIAAKYGDDIGDLYYMEADHTLSNIPNVDAAFPNVFPNPVKDQASIVLPSAYAYQAVHIDILNVAGQVVSSRENILGKDIVIDRTGLPTGQYLFRVGCKDGKIFKGKFMVE